MCQPLSQSRTAEEKDQQTKLEILPPYVRSDDPKKIYAEPWTHTQKSMIVSVVVVEVQRTTWNLASDCTDDGSC